MSANTRLLVLGAVKIRQPANGYTVRRELLGWGVSDWTNLEPGSIYHQLRSLTKHEMLEVADVQRRRAVPASTFYRLTDIGDVEFTSLLRRIVWTVSGRAEDILVGLCFLPYLSRDEAIAAMEARINQLDAHQAAGKFQPERAAELAHLQEAFHLDTARASAETEWTAALIERLRAGAYVMAGEQNEHESPRDGVRR